MESQFEFIVKEDCNQFRDLAKKFMNLNIDDIDTSGKLAIESWLLATRWSDISSNASKYALDHDINKTAFANWCHERYRQLQEMHITCRAWNRQAREDYKANQMINGGT